ncbi:MAG: MATE family efflux transporter [Chloroflexota bacterium]
MKNNDSILSEVIKLAWPVILTNLLQTLVTIVDTLMVGRLGPVAIAAVGLSNAFRLLVLVALLAVSAGGMSLVAQARGARDPVRMAFVVRQAFISGLLISVPLTLVGYFGARPILSLVNAGGDPAATELGTSYLQILFLGTPFLVLNLIINRIMQGAGDTITPLFLTGGLNIFNILFNYLLIFGIGPFPAMGLDGAAMGTIIARFIGVVIALIIIWSGRNLLKFRAADEPIDWRPDWQLIWDILVIGVPSGLQGIVRNGARLLTIGIVTSTEVGSMGAAALAIGVQVESLGILPVLGLNVASTSLVGRALGKWQLNEAWKRGTTAIWLGVSIMAVFVLPMIIFAPQILRLFDPSANEVLLSAGVTYMRINTVVLPIGAVSMVANGALRGGGDTLPGMFATITSLIFTSVPLAWLLAHPLGFGSVGVWYALAVGILLNGTIMAVRWRSGKWIDVALSKTEVYRQYLHELPQAEQDRYLTEVRAPEMAIEDTVETVEENGIVTYVRPGKDSSYKFKNQTFIPLVNTPMH